MIKLNKSRKQITKEINHSYYNTPKDYTTIRKAVKYVCITMMVLIFLLAAYKAIRSDTSEVDAAITRVDEYINRVDFTSENSLKAFSESFVELYLSSNIPSDDKKELIGKYISGSSNEFEVVRDSGVDVEVISASLSDIEEVSTELINASVLARTVTTITVVNQGSTGEPTEIKKIKDYILKLPIKVTIADDGEFLYSIYKSPSFVPLSGAGESYQGSFTSMSQLSTLEISKHEGTIKSFLKVYLEGTDEEIKYFYIGEDHLKGLSGEILLASVDKIAVYKIEGSDALIAYANITTEDEFGSRFKNSYEMKLIPKEDKYYIEEFGLKNDQIYKIENQEE